MQSTGMTEYAMKGNLTGIDLSIQVGFDPKEFESSALQGAASQGQLPALRKLLPLSCQQGINISLQLAAEFGHVECLRELLPFADPTAEESKAFKRAFAAAQFDCAELLAPVSDIKQNNSIFLRIGIWERNERKMLLVMPFSDIDAVRTVLSESFDHDSLQFLTSVIEKNSLQDKYHLNEMEKPKRATI